MLKEFSTYFIKKQTKRYELKSPHDIVNQDKATFNVSVTLTSEKTG